MTTIIMRSALVAWGRNPPPELAYVVAGEAGFLAKHPNELRVVTWADVLAERRKRQKDQLAWKRCAPKVRAYKLWVAYFDQPFYGGWHAFLENRDGCVWLRNHDFAREKLMRLFPLVLPLGSEEGDFRSQWALWMEEFARTYKRRTQDRRPVGVAYVWSADGTRGPFWRPGNRRPEARP